MLRRVISSIRPSLLRHYANQAQKFEKCINQVTLLGRVGIDPAVRGTEQNPVVTFSLATNSVFKTANEGLAQRAEWHRISVFQPNLRDLSLQYIKKGMRIYLSGRLSYGQITDASGVTRTATSIIADDIIFLSSADTRQMSEEAKDI